MEEKFKKQETVLGLEDVLALFLSRWYWFVGCVLIALGVAVFYIFRSTPIFTRSTQLLIREDDSKGGSGSMLQNFQDLGMLGGNTNINNEILTLSAPILMEKTVGRLHLDLQMLTADGLHMRPFYNDAPLKLTFASSPGEETGFTFVVRLKKKKKLS